MPEVLRTPDTPMEVADRVKVKLAAGLAGSYQRVALSKTAEDKVRSKLRAFLDACSGSTDDEKRCNLPVLRSMVHEAVAYVQAGLPSGVARVDGYCVKGLLAKEADEKVAALPAPAPAPAEE